MVHCPVWRAGGGLQRLPPPPLHCGERQGSPESDQLVQRAPPCRPTVGVLCWACLGECWLKHPAVSWGGWWAVPAVEVRGAFQHSRHAVPGVLVLMGPVEAGVRLVQQLQLGGVHAARVGGLMCPVPQAPSAVVQPCAAAAAWHAGLLECRAASQLGLGTMLSSQEGGVGGWRGGGTRGAAKQAQGGLWPATWLWRVVAVGLSCTGPSPPRHWLHLGGPLGGCGRGAQRGWAGGLQTGRG